MLIVLHGYTGGGHGDSKAGVRNPAGKGRCKECLLQHPGAPRGQMDDEDAVEKISLCGPDFVFWT